jgi:photosystem II stability/assembly factor-like uncharacterized protein
MTRTFIILTRRRPAQASQQAVYPGTPFNRRCPRAISAALVFFAFVFAACGSRDDAIVVIAPHPAKPDILYVATNEYIYKTRDEGTTWEKITGGMSHSRVIAIAIDPTSPAVVYAGTKGDAVYKSYDGGQRWVGKNNGLEDVTMTSVVNQIVFDPSNADHVFAATTMGVFESSDGGDSWKKRMEGMTEVLMVVTVVIDPVTPQIMYAGTSGGVYKSVDMGRRWEKANRGLISPDLLSSSRALMVNSLVINPATAVRPSTVYAATLTGLYKTIDSAGSWSRIAQDIPDQMIIALAVDLRGILYAAGRKGVYKSLDNGVTWSAMNRGLGSLNIRSLAVSPLDPSTIYAGTNGTGLYRSRDGGERWESVRLSVTQARRS